MSHGSQDSQHITIHAWIGCTLVRDILEPLTIAYSLILLCKLIMLDKRLILKEYTKSTSTWRRYKSESKIKLFRTWKIHRGISLSTHTAKFLGNTQIILLSPGLTGMQKKIRSILRCFCWTSAEEFWNNPSWIW